MCLVCEAGPDCDCYSVLRSAGSSLCKLSVVRKALRPSAGEAASPHICLVYHLVNSHVLFRWAFLCFSSLRWLLVVVVAFYRSRSISLSLNQVYDPPARLRRIVGNITTDFCHHGQVYDQQTADGSVGAVQQRSYCACRRQ